MTALECRSAQGKVVQVPDGRVGVIMQYTGGWADVAFLEGDPDQKRQRFDCAVLERYARS